MNQNERNKQFGNDLSQIIEKNLDLKKWGFKHSFEDFGDNAGLSFRRIIFDSEWCRVKFQYSYRGLPETNELNIYYGRLHAPSNADVIVTEGEMYRAWTGYGWVHILFLEGLSPNEAFEQMYNGKYQEIVKKVLNSSISDFQQESIPKRFIMMEAAKWEYYGTRLFELFDLRHVDNWEKYKLFLKEFYKIQDEYSISKGYKPLLFDPPLFKVF